MSAKEVESLLLLSRCCCTRRPWWRPWRESFHLASDEAALQPCSHYTVVEPGHQVQPVDGQCEFMCTSLPMEGCCQYNAPNGTVSRSVSSRIYASPQRVSFGTQVNDAREARQHIWALYSRDQEIHGLSDQLTRLWPHNSSAPAKHLFTFTIRQLERSSCTCAACSIDADTNDDTTSHRLLG